MKVRLYDLVNMVFMYENVYGLENWNDVVFVKNVCVLKLNDLWFLYGLGGGGCCFIWYWFYLLVCLKY